MRTNATALVISIISIYVVLIGAACSTPTSDATSLPPATHSWALSTDPEIAAALKLVETIPDSPVPYTCLASTYIKKARTTGNFAANSEAVAAVEQALRIAPGDINARKLRASLYLTFHQFANGLELGKQLQSEIPNDSFVWGVLTDANAELGNYTEAVAAAQRMVDLKPSGQSYARIAHLRSLHGDHAGAIEMFKLAARTTDPLDKDAQSSCLVQLGDELWKNGKYKEAEKVYDEALAVLPDYHLALVGKGRVRAAQNNFAGAKGFLLKARDRFPATQTIILLGDVYARLGDSQQAEMQYSLAQSGESKPGDLYDAHRIALFWADHDMNLDRALEVAQNDYAAQKDIYASDTLAWCLYKKGRLQEAKVLIGEAMRIKTNDARILFHAGMIDSSLGHRKVAATLIKTALKLNPQFDLLQAEAARTELMRLSDVL